MELLKNKIGRVAETVRYEASREIPDPMGSGSTHENVAYAHDEASALALLDGIRNNLTRTVRVDGRTRRHYYDVESRTWRDGDGNELDWSVMPNEENRPRPRPGQHACPRCGHMGFLATAHVAQGWEIDADGSFVKCTAECEEIDHAPDDDDIWTCARCGFDGPGKDFLYAGKDIEKEAHKA